MCILFHFSFSFYYSSKYIIKYYSNENDKSIYKEQRELSEVYLRSKYYSSILNDSSDKLKIWFLCFSFMRNMNTLK
jgi:hypothetical protein